jgi:acyl dehydratase
MSEMTYDVAAVKREWVGKVVRQTRGRYPVEHDPIRRHCHMVGDSNPLFLDPTFAETGPYGAVIVPPTTLVAYFSGNGPWPPRPKVKGHRSGPGFASGVPTPGDRGINLKTAWEFFQPVRVGDWLSAEQVIADVFLRPIRLDPEAVCIVTDTEITNQRGEIVAINTNTVLVHRSPKQVAEADDTQQVT